MAKHIAFQQLLTGGEFRWPQSDDVLIRLADNPRDNAALASHGDQRLAHMTKGYEEAARLIVEAALNGPVPRDFLIYPIFFNYRHALELNLKFLIAEYGPSMGLEPIWNTHDLAKLWERFSEVSKAWGTHNSDDAEPIVGRIVTDFNDIDARADYFRFATDRKGDTLPLHFQHVDLRGLSEVMDGAFNFFLGTDSYWDDLRGSMPR